MCPQYRLTSLTAPSIVRPSPATRPIRSIAVHACPSGHADTVRMFQRRTVNGPTRADLPITDQNFGQDCVTTDTRGMSCYMFALPVTQRCVGDDDQYRDIFLKASLDYSLACTSSLRL